MKKLIFLLCQLALCCCCISRCDITDVAEHTDEGTGSESHYSILFIGASYFSLNDLPNMVKSLCDAGGDTVYIGTAIMPGTYLDYHAQSSYTEEKINEREWDFVVLQGVCTNTAYPDIFTAHPVMPALRTLKGKIEANSDSTRMVYCMPFAFEDGMTWKDGWTDTYVDMQTKIYDYTLTLADTLNMMIAPVGWAWKSVLETKGYPLHYLHIKDWNHPSYRGSYLMATVIYTTVSQKSCRGLPYGGAEDEGELLQNTASRIVLENLELWHIQ